VHWMQIKSLKIFCDIVRLGSFSKAAELNAVSQPKVSQMVHHLEERIGVQLIDRSKRPFLITPEGQKYYEGCRDVVARYEELEQEVRALRDQVADKLSVAAIYSVGLGQMHRIVGDFRDEAEGVELRVEYMHPNRVHEAVLSGKADLGIVSYPEGDKKLAVRPWREEAFAVAVAPDHPLAAAATTTVESLRDQPMVMPQTGLKVRDEVERWLASRRTPARVALEFDNLESVKRAIEVGEGIGLLPATTFAAETLSGTLVRVDLATPDGKPDTFVRPLGVIRRRDEDLSSAATLFVNLLERHADDPPEPDSLRVPFDQKQEAHSTAAEAV
jgi:DNA-binding transcriptional LysR family regulator